MAHNLPQRAFTSTAVRNGHMWLVQCDQRPSVRCQAANLSRARVYQRRELALLLRVPEDCVTVDVRPVIPDDARAHLDRARELRATATSANHTAATEVRAAARILAAKHLSLRDIGIILGVSHQRAHQLIRAT